MAASPITFALNHMTAPYLDDPELLSLAKQCGCDGVEFRNDFSHRSLFGGRSPAEIRTLVEAEGLTVHALSELKRFNNWTYETRSDAEILAKTAKAIGAKAISLIPVNDGTGCGNGERQANLRIALRELKPILEVYDLIGNVEPLGFELCSLRYKEDVADAIEALNARDRFRIIHDTFHHFLAGELLPIPKGFAEQSFTSAESRFI